MACKIEHQQRPPAQMCPHCMEERLDYIEKTLRNITLQLNQIEECIVPKIEDENKTPTGK